MSLVTFEYDVTNALAVLIDCTISDAQSIVDCQQELLEQCYNDNMDSEETAEAIDKASIVR